MKLAKKKTFLCRAKNIFLFIVSLHPELLFYSKLSTYLHTLTNFLSLKLDIKKCKITNPQDSLTVFNCPSISKCLKNTYLSDFRVEI